MARPLKVRELPVNKGGGPPSTGLGLSLQEPGGRLKTLAAKHGVASIFRAMTDEKYLDKTFSTYDGMLIMGLGNSLKGSGEERERMLNRMFGKVPDKTINLNLNVDIEPTQLSERAQEMLNRIASDDDD